MTAMLSVTLRSQSSSWEGSLAQFTKSCKASRNHCQQSGESIVVSAHCKPGVQHNLHSEFCAITACRQSQSCDYSSMGQQQTDMMRWVTASRSTMDSVPNPPPEDMSVPLYNATDNIRLGCAMPTRPFWHKCKVCWYLSQHIHYITQYTTHIITLCFSLVCIVYPICNMHIIHNVNYLALRLV